METTLETYKLARDADDFMTPHACSAVYICPNSGTDLAEIEPFTAQLTTIVDHMKETLVNERRILEGTTVPEYGKGEWSLPENELSKPETKDDQWRMPSQSGCWKIDPTHISTDDSETSFTTVEALNPGARIQVSNDAYIRLRTLSSADTLDGFGCETEITNESSECTVPMINEQTLGTQSEAK